MNYESFKYTSEEGVGHLILDKGEDLNKMTMNFWYELPRILDEIDKDASLRVLILSSTGKHFCAGMDLKNFGTLGNDAEKKTNVPDKARIGESLYRVAKELQDMLSKLEKLRIPVLAGIQGGCIGGGLDLVTAADMRFASKDAFFCIQEVNIGMAADIGTLQRLPRVIPEGKVRELAYTGRRMPAGEALEAGLVNKVYESHEEMVSGLKEMAAVIASKSPLAVYGTKAILNFSRDHTIAEGLEYNALWSGAMLPQEDMAEAMMSNIEKREPEFKDMQEIKDYGKSSAK
ncbi:MAG: crotonase/enoyl-CoA hydratase family protein [Gammaproteobacteria bacterium]|jgi:enoyl-CoA hydratase|tara:strand:- start:827 stop:1690 length:864 start_codon:yes stop_codon:yes gene_type:complete